jgi:pyruvate dehydrogenase E1 component beta subunit
MKQLNNARAINEAIKEEMQRDERVCVLGEDVGYSGGPFTLTRGLIEEFGEWRLRDTPISEASMVGIAVGAAMTGLRPIVDIMFMDFFGLIMDQVFNQAGKTRWMFAGKVNLPIVITTLTGAGLNAGPQHSSSLEAWCCHIPGIKVVMPTTPYETKGLLKASIRDDNPVIFCIHKGMLRLKADIPEEEYVIPLGKAVVRKEGKDVTVVAVQQMSLKALSVAQKLEGEGISVEVIDPLTLSPLDLATIVESVKKTGRLVIVHEAVKKFGVGAEIAMSVMEEAFDYLDAPVVRVAAPFTHVPFTPTLEKAFVPQEEDILKAIKGVCA